MTILNDCRYTEPTHWFSTILLQTWCFIKRLTKRYKQWEERRQNLDLLLSMEDRMLKDIGQSRADAVRINHENGFWNVLFPLADKDDVKVNHK